MAFKVLIFESNLQSWAKIKIEWIQIGYVKGYREK